MTSKCQTGTHLFEGKQLFVVDTPGFLDERIDEEEIKIEIGTSYEMTATPGPHAFLLVIEPGRFLPQEAEAIQYLTKIFGGQAINHTIIVFTHAENFRKTSVEQYLEKLKEDSPLRTLVRQCQNRYITVSNYGNEQDKQQSISNLLKMVENLLEKNNGEVYRSKDFDEIAQAIIKEKEKGTYKPFKQDGSFHLLPQTKQIIIDGRLRRNLGRGLFDS